MSFSTAYATKKRQGKGYKGEGVAEDKAALGDADMIARILHKRKEYASGGMVPEDDGMAGEEQEGGALGAMMPKFSEGGQVANDVGVAEADKLPAEYDDLVLRDTLEDTSDAGNEIGDENLDDESADMVAKIINKRKK